MEIRDASPAYVQERIGAELYSHLRGVPAITAFRRASVGRAYKVYESALERGAEELEVTRTSRRGACSLHSDASISVAPVAVCAFTASFEPLRKRPIGPASTAARIARIRAASARCAPEQK